MSRIRSAETAPELRLRRALWGRGIRYRLRLKLPGKPDVVLTRARIAIFVDGCFWHGCPVHGTQPKSNESYWLPKIERNRARDLEVTKQLEGAGWKVLRFWEHELKQDLEAVTAKIERNRDEEIERR